MIVLVVGDSHAQYFRTSNQLVQLVPGLGSISAYVKVSHGATLAGVGRMNSTLHLGENTRQWIERARPRHVIFNLGQVDIELGIPFRRFVKNNPSSFDAHMESFIDSYFSFINSLEYDPARITVKGINLPVLVNDRSRALKYIERIVTDRFTGSAEDLACAEEVRAGLAMHYPSDAERTALAYSFNERMKSAAATAGVSYFDINDALIDPATGIVKAEYIPFGFDHHLAPSLELHAVHWRRALPLISSDTRR